MSRSVQEAMAQAAHEDGGEGLAPWLDDMPEEERIRRLLDGGRTRHEARGRRRRSLVAGAAGAVVGVALVVLWAGIPGIGASGVGSEASVADARPGGPELSGGGVPEGLTVVEEEAHVAPIASARPTPSALLLTSGAAPALTVVDAAVGGSVEMQLADASRITLAEGQLVPQRNDGERFEVMLAGEARFEVTPGGPRRWVVHAGDVTVEVVGTVFEVSADEGRGAGRGAVRVVVERGVVRVTGGRVPGGEQLLRAGDALEVPAAGPPGGASIALGEGRRPFEPPEPIEPTESWRAHAEAGGHRRAYEELGADGLSAAAATAGPDALLLLADVARYSGHPRQAVPPLEAVLRDYSGHALAPLAALALGRLEMDVLRRPERAQAALARAAELGVPAVLRDDLEARLATFEYGGGGLGEPGAAVGDGDGRDSTP